MALILGAIADDFTGATDLANTLVNEGMRVTQVIGIPDETTDFGDAQAVVVALKSRTAPINEAIEDSLCALNWLQSKGVEQTIFKYCSTFDSTSEGNIGPVADALLESLNSDFALVCPAFPKNGRTVYKGHLFVGDQLLSDSPMKDHPLTPMRESDLVRLMSAQSTGETALIPLSDVMAGPESVAKKIRELKQAGIRYGIADAVTETDLRCLGQAVSEHKLITGGSGIALNIPNNFRKTNRLDESIETRFPSVEGREVVLAGSCSEATRIQIRSVQKRWPTYKLDVARIAQNEDVVAEAVQWAKDQPASAPVVIYGSSDPDEVREMQDRYGAHQAGKMVEDTLGEIAIRLRESEFSRFVVAGGETSGAVVSALEIKVLRIGAEIALGVPWTETLGEGPLALALKSGNFGGPDFFDEAFSLINTQGK